MYLIHRFLLLLRTFDKKSEVACPAIWHREFFTSLKEVRRATCVFRQFEVIESSHRRTGRFIFKVTDLHL